MKKGEFNLKGFTIIEVSLVLAIAGLIFLMIFIALPALQRQQRDTARKEDVNAFVSAVKKYQTNNRGALPSDASPSTSWNKFVGDYLNDGFEDPSTGEAYKLVVKACGGNGKDPQCVDNNEWQKVLTGSFDENVGNLYVVTQAKCAGDESKGVVPTSNTRKFAVLFKLENGGLFCQDA